MIYEKNPMGDHSRYRSTTKNRTDGRNKRKGVDSFMEKRKLKTFSTERSGSSREYR